jgi:uncharacterized membrane protein
MTQTTIMSTRGFSLNEAKVLGGLGSILTLLGLAPFIGTALVVAGWVLVLAAIGLISVVAENRSIFYNGIVGAGLQMVGAIGLYFVGLGIFGYFSGSSSSSFLGFYGSFFGWLMLLWVIAMVSSIFLYMSLKTIATKLNVGLFATAAIIYVVAEGTTVILIGFVIALIAQILFAVAFFTMPEKLPMGSPAAASNSPSAPITMPNVSPELRVATSPQRSFCSSCGAKLETGARYCPYCGAETNASSQS